MKERYSDCSNLEINLEKVEYVLHHEYLFSWNVISMLSQAGFWLSKNTQLPMFDERERNMWAE